MLNELAFIIGTTLMYATPLIFASLGGVVSENSGVINIGIEGMMTFGAFVASWVTLSTSNPWTGLLAGACAGGFLGLIHAFVSIKLKANQVVSGIAINFLGPGLAIFICRLVFEGTSMTPALTMEQKIPRPFQAYITTNSFFDLAFNHYATVYLALLLVPTLSFIFYRTKLGLRLRSCGEHQKAGETLGLKIANLRYLAVISSGVLSGIGGASLSLAIVSNFRPTLISGQGFIALAAMIFGKWTPQGAFAASLFFGLAQSLVIYLGGKENLVVSSQLLSLLPYVLTLLILVIFVGKSRAPNSLGQ